MLLRIRREIFKVGEFEQHREFTAMKREELCTKYRLDKDTTQFFGEDGLLIEGDLIDGQIVTAVQEPAATGVVAAIAIISAVIAAGAATYAIVKSVQMRKQMEELANKKTIETSYSYTVRGSQNQTRRMMPVGLLFGSCNVCGDVAGLPYSTYNNHIDYAYWKSVGTISKELLGTMVGRNGNTGEDMYQEIHQLFCYGYNEPSPKNNKHGWVEMEKHPDFVKPENPQGYRIHIGDSPIDTLKDYALAVKEGSTTMDAIFNVRVVEENVSIKMKNDWLQKTTATNTVIIGVGIIAPYGYYKANDSGGRDYTPCDYVVQYKDVNSADVESNWITAFDAQNYQAADYGTLPLARKDYRHMVQVSVPSGQYDVRVKNRLYTDTTDPALCTTLDWDVLQSWTESPIDTTVTKFAPIKHPERYSLLALKVRATDQLNGYLDKVYTKSHLVCRAYTGDYTETSNFENYWQIPSDTQADASVKAMSNPASVLLYLLTDPKANPRPLKAEQIDWVSFRDWYKFCSTGGRDWTCNAWVTEPITVGELAQRVCSSGRARFVLNDGLYGVAIDTKTDVVSQVFTPRNAWGMKEVKDFDERINLINASFVNEETETQENVYVYINDREELIFANDGEGLDEGNFKSQSVNLWGVTNGKQAQQLSAYQLVSSYRLNRTYTWECGIESIMSTVGDVVYLANDIFMFSLGYGRIESAIFNSAGTQIIGVTIDEAVGFEPDKTYGICVRDMSNTDHSTEYQIDNATSTNRTLMFTTPISADVDIMSGNLFIYGDKDTVGKKVIITEIKPSNDRTATITAVDYYPDLYDVDVNPSKPIPAYQSNISKYGGGVNLNAGAIPSMSSQDPVYPPSGLNIYYAISAFYESDEPDKHPIDVLETEWLAIQPIPSLTKPYVWMRTKSSVSGAYIYTCLNVPSEPTVTVLNSYKEFAVSDSDSVAPALDKYARVIPSTGSDSWWLGRYVWSRTITVFSDGSTVTGTGVYDSPTTDLCIGSCYFNSYTSSTIYQYDARRKNSATTISLLYDIKKVYVGYKNPAISWSCSDPRITFNADFTECYIPADYTEPTVRLICTLSYDYGADTTNVRRTLEQVTTINKIAVDVSPMRIYNENVQTGEQREYFTSLERMNDSEDTPQPYPDESGIYFIDGDFAIVQKRKGHYQQTTDTEYNKNKTYYIYAPDSDVIDDYNERTPQEAQADFSAGAVLYEQVLDEADTTYITAPTPVKYNGTVWEFTDDESIIVRTLETALSLVDTQAKLSSYQGFFVTLRSVKGIFDTVVANNATFTHTSTDTIDSPVLFTNNTSIIAGTRNVVLGDDVPFFRMADLVAYIQTLMSTYNDFVTSTGSVDLQRNTESGFVPVRYIGIESVLYKDFDGFAWKENELYQYLLSKSYVTDRHGIPFGSGQICKTVAGVDTPVNYDKLLYLATDADRTARRDYVNMSVTNEQEITVNLSYPCADTVIHYTPIKYSYDSYTINGTLIYYYKDTPEVRRIVEAVDTHLNITQPRSIGLIQSKLNPRNETDYQETGYETGSLVVASGVENSIIDIEYSSTLKRFVAVSYDALLWSDDGKNFTVGKTNTRGSISTRGKRVVWEFYLGKFFALDSTGIYSSSDGESWSLCSGTSGVAFESIACRYPSKIVANVDGRTLDTILYYSTDGNSWSTKTLRIPVEQLCIDYNGLHFCALPKFTGSARNVPYVYFISDDLSDTTWSWSVSLGGVDLSTGNVLMRGCETSGLVIINNNNSTGEVFELSTGDGSYTRFYNFNARTCCCCCYGDCLYFMALVNGYSNRYRIYSYNVWGTKNAQGVTEYGWQLYDQAGLDVVPQCFFVAPTYIGSMTLSTGVYHDFYIDELLVGGKVTTTSTERHLTLFYKRIPYFAFQPDTAGAFHVSYDYTNYELGLNFLDIASTGHAVLRRITSSSNALIKNVPCVVLQDNYVNVVRINSASSAPVEMPLSYALCNAKRGLNLYGNLRTKLGTLEYSDTYWYSGEVHLSGIVDFTSEDLPVAITNRAYRIVGVFVGDTQLNNDRIVGTEKFSQFSCVFDKITGNTITHVDFTDIASVLFGGQNITFTPTTGNTITLKSSDLFTALVISYTPDRAEVRGVLLGNTLPKADQAPVYMGSENQPFEGMYANNFYGGNFQGEQFDLTSNGILGVNLKKALYEIIYPIGCAYTSFTDSRDPREILDWAESHWEKISDRMIVAQGTSFPTPLATGGEINHKLTVNEMPSHNHTFTGDSHSHTGNTLSSDFSIVVATGEDREIVTGSASVSRYSRSDAHIGLTGDSVNHAQYSVNMNGKWTGKTNDVTVTGSNSATGGGQSHNNMPPYIVAYVWRRVAPPAKTVRRKTSKTDT